MKPQSSSDNESDAPEKPPALEWAIAGLGLLVVAGTLFFLVTEAFQDGDSPPRLEATVESVTPAPDGYLVRFVVQNSGERTAAAVAVEGELTRDGQPVETGEVTLDYVPSRSSRRGGLLFSADPGTHELKVRAKGFSEP